MNEIARAYIVSLGLYLPPKETMNLIKKMVGLYHGFPFYIQPFTGNA